MWPYWWPLEGQRIRRHHVSLLGKSCHLKCMALLLVRVVWIVITRSFLSTWLFQMVLQIRLWRRPSVILYSGLANHFFLFFAWSQSSKKQKSDGILYFVKKSCCAQKRHFWSQTRHLSIFLKLYQMKAIKKWVKVILHRIIFMSKIKLMGLFQPWSINWSLNLFSLNDDDKLFLGHGWLTKGV